MDVSDRQARNDVYAALFNGAPMPVYEHDLTGTVVRWNAAAERAFGWTRAEAVGTPLPFLSASQLEELLAAQGGASEVTRVRLTGMRRDGSAIALEIVNAPALASDGVGRSVVAIADEVGDGDADYRAVVDCMSDPIYVLEPDDGRFLIRLCNDAYLRFRGYRSDELLGRSLHDVLPDAVADESLSHVEEAIAAGRTLEYEQEGDLDGRRQAVSKRVTPVLAADGSPLRVIVALHDITATRRAERGLRFTAQLLDELPNAVIALDREGCVTHWNRAAEERTGVAAAAAIGERARDLFADRPLGRDDHPLVAAVVEGRRWQGELLGEGPDGRLRSSYTTTTPLKEDDGVPAGALIVSTDLTELRAAERELLDSTARVRSILDRVSDAYFMLDRSGRLTDLNNEAIAVLGRGRDELVGRPALETFPGAAGTTFESELRRAMHDSVAVAFEEFLPTLDAWLSVQAYPVDDGGLSVYFRDVTEQRRAEEQIAYLAYHDDLTGLPNRTRFRQHLDLALARSRRDGSSVAVLYLDLDDFKLVNDSLGHSTGDELLQLMATRLRGISRESDLLSRQGGDEFLLLLADLADGPAGSPAEQGLAAAERIHRALATPFHLADVEFFTGASVGISIYPNDADSADALLRHADSAMYEAKRGGRGATRLYTGGTADPLARLSLAARLRRALERNEFELHWQPIVALASGAVMGAEALLRWYEPQRGLVMPGEFIALAEDTGLIEPIGDWVIGSFCEQSRAFDDAGLRIETAFNLSMRQLWQPGIASKLIDAVDGQSLDPARVVVEVTETAAMTDPERAARILADLSERGLRLALDDFGTGYSSLSRLTTLPADYIKIDRSFVSQLPGDDSAASMVSLVLQLARSLGMEPLAEGIESDAQRRFLAERGCRHGQGFLFSAAVPADELAALARSRGAAA